MSSAAKLLSEELIEERREEQRRENEQDAAQTSGDSMIDAYRQEIATQTAEVERLRTWLSRIRNNAQSWHGTDPDGIDHAHHGQQKALNVIAGWCEEALNGE